MIELRPYQIAIDELTYNSFKQSFRAPLIVAPCGAGKTVIFSHFTNRAKNRGKNILILAHREELIDQISDTLDLFNTEHSFIAASPGRLFHHEMPVQVGSVFTVARRLNKTPIPDLIICDEAHHCTKKSTWGRIFAHLQNELKFGVTATPKRLSGEALGDIFDDMIIGPSVRELIDLGALCDYRLYAPSKINVEGIHTRMGDYAKSELAKAADKPSITGDAIAEYKKLANGKRAIVFCVSIEHSKHVADQFTRSGYSASCIDGTMDRGLRRHIVERFRSGAVQVLTSVDIVSEGFDLPAIEVAIMLRPTQSLALHIQQTGRALRPLPGKEYAIILDHAGNCQKHGLPCMERNWSLDGKSESKKKTDNTDLVRICPKCFAASAAFRRACQYCKHEFVVESREVDHIPGELVEVDHRAARIKSAKEQFACKTVNELEALGKRRGMKYPRRWAEYVIKSRTAKRRRNEIS